MTHEELKIKLEGYFPEITDWERNLRVKGIIETVINQHVKEVIGEEENDDINDWYSGRISLIKEQRERAGL